MDGLVVPDVGEQNLLGRREVRLREGVDDATVEVGLELLGMKASCRIAESPAAKSITNGSPLAGIPVTSSEAQAETKPGRSTSAPPKPMRRRKSRRVPAAWSSERLPSSMRMPKASATSAPMD